MSVASEIERLEACKSDIASAIESKGASVQSGAKLDQMADLIRGLETTPDGLAEILLDATGVS